MIKANLREFLELFEPKRSDFIQSLDGLTAVSIAEDIKALKAVVQKKIQHQNKKSNNNNNNR